MTEKLFRYLLMFLVVFYSCTSKHEKMTAEIKELEESVRTQAIPDKKVGGELVSKYIEFADAFPDDSLAPTVLFNAARLSLALNDPENSLSYLERLIENYYASKPVADAYVLNGFIYETVYQDYENARYWYELFLKEFPNHEMYEDIRFSLNNLGKTPEELVAEFMKKNLEESN